MPKHSHIKRIKKKWWNRELSLNKQAYKREWYSFKSGITAKGSFMSVKRQYKNNVNTFVDGLLQTNAKKFQMQEILKNSGNVLEKSPNQL